jgi:toxin ParE1/3/4
MTRVEFTARAVRDLDRVAAHLVEHEAADVNERLQDLKSGFDILERHPEIGRRCDDRLRELVIGRGSRGYVALYSHEAALDFVLVLAIRGQREEGYSRGS